MFEKQKRKIETCCCVANKSTGFVLAELRSGDRGGGIEGVLDIHTIVGDSSLLEGGNRTYVYKPVWVGTQQLVINPLFNFKLLILCEAIVYIEMMKPAIAYNPVLE